MATEYNRVRTDQVRLFHRFLPTSTTQCETPNLLTFRKKCGSLLEPKLYQVAVRLVIISLQSKKLNKHLMDIIAAFVLAGMYMKEV